MSQSMTLGHAFPCSHPLYAVTADENGEPLFHRVQCMGMLQNQHHCVVVGMINSDGHLEAADSLREHVGYTSEIDPSTNAPYAGAWAERCRIKRDELTALEDARKNGPQIIVPDRTVKPSFH